MSVQYIEIAGEKMAMLPAADYERLLGLAEDRADVQAAEQAASRRVSGEEYVPAEVVDRILSGENPLKVWRKFRRLTQSELARLVKREKAYISKLETGRSQGGVDLWKDIAGVLNVAIEDILPVN